MNGKEQAGCFVAAVAAVALLVICRFVSGGNDEMPSSSSKPHAEAADTAKAKPLPRTPAAPLDVPRRVTCPADAGDAYAEGYDNGYAQGRNDGVRGQYRGYGYDDNRNAPDKDASRYSEGYDDGYTDGYNSGEALYNEGGETEYGADIW